jgi:hypothetical protein
VGNHKLELISPMKSLQYGAQSSALPVETSRNVGDDLGVRVEFSHLGDLPFQVPTLLRRTDPAVTDDLGGGLLSQVSVHVVEPLAAGVAVVGDFAFSGIASQSLRV